MSKRKEKKYGCQQNLLSDNSIDEQTDLFDVLKYLCAEANNLANCGTYYARQWFFRTGKYIGKFDLDAQYKTNRHYQAMHSQAAQQCLLSVYESFKSYRELASQFVVAGDLQSKPRLPKYRKKGGLTVVSYPKQALKMVDDTIRVPLGKAVKRWFGLEAFFIPVPTNLDWSTVSELRILPRNNQFYAEFVYPVGIKPAEVDLSKVLGIDPGLNNWLTCVSNIGKSFIIDGRQLKSQNQWYNKRVATLKEGKPQAYWDSQLAAITEKRNRQTRDAVNKAARFVLNHCLAKRIGTIVFGWNKGNKNGIEIGKKNNQEFVQIPTAKLKARIAQLCEQYGLCFVETEESYTSKSSFLDHDFLPTFGERPESWKPSGRRGQRLAGKRHNLGRGGYKTAKGLRVNSDCNGAANILKKVATHLGISLAEVGKAALTLPKRYRLDSLSKSYREQYEVHGFSLPHNNV